MATYNGWNNYATFRVANDILNDITFEDSVTIDDLKEIVRFKVFGDNTPRSLATDYANLFLNNVDWNELAEVYNTDILTRKLHINE
jgi:hypothetical protein